MFVQGLSLWVCGMLDTAMSQHILCQVPLCEGTGPAPTGTMSRINVFSACHAEFPTFKRQHWVLDLSLSPSLEPCTYAIFTVDRDGTPFWDPSGVRRLEVRMCNKSTSPHDPCASRLLFLLQQAAYPGHEPSCVATAWNQDQPAMSG